MTYSNGHYPSSALSPIPGNGRLRRDAAVAYNAMAQRASRGGVSLAIVEGSIRRTYREYSAQVAARRMWCNAGRCGNAAVPGTSNHGLALAVDLMSTRQRSWIDRHGASFGWAKAWSDAPWEWWHLRWRVMSVKHFHPGPRVLRRGSRPGKDVGHLKRLLHKIAVRGDKRHRYWRSDWKINNAYGRRVRRAVKAFQRDHHLKADAVVGPHTWAAIKRAAS